MLTEQPGTLPADFREHRSMLATETLDTMTLLAVTNVLEMIATLTAVVVDVTRVDSRFTSKKSHTKSRHAAAPRTTIMTIPRQTATMVGLLLARRITELVVGVPRLRGPLVIGTTTGNRDTT